MAWWILALMVFLQVMTALGQFSYTVLIPFVQQDLHLSAAQVGGLPTAMFLGSMLTNPFTGIVTDRLGVRRTIVFGPGSFGLLVAALATAPGYLGLLAILFCVGATYGFINPLSVKALIAWFPPRLRGLVFGLKQSGVTMGAAAAALLTPVALAWGWRVGFFTAGALLVLAVVVCSLLYGEPPGAAANRLVPVGLGGAVALMRNRSFLAVVCAGFSFSGYQMAVATFLIPYLTGALGMGVVPAAGHLALSQLGGAVARPLAGLLSDRVGRKQSLVLGSLLGAGGGLWLGLLGPAASPRTIWLVVLLLGTGAYAWAGLYFLLAAELAGPARSGTAAGLASAFNSAGGAVVPLAWGLVVDRAGHRPAMLAFSLAAAVCSAVLTGFPLRGIVHDSGPAARGG